MDFINAELPSLKPLRNSFTVDDIEDQLRNMFIDLFDNFLARDAFDANVLGAAHLGSFDLVKRTINKDGLVLLPGNLYEPATRYIYRAWKATNLQGRGLHFLRTYLQNMYADGSWSVDQQMQLTAGTYPNDLSNVADTGSDTNKYLTSRIKINLKAKIGEITDTSKITNIMASILPARFVPILSVDLVDISIVNLNIGAIGIGSITLVGGGITT